MVTRTQQAFAEASRLSRADQGALANWILEEIAAELRWRDAFASSADRLAALAEEARRDFEAGETEPLDPNRL